MHPRLYVFLDILLHPWLSFSGHPTAELVWLVLRARIRNWIPYLFHTEWKDNTLAHSFRYILYDVDKIKQNVFYQFSSFFDVRKMAFSLNEQFYILKYGYRHLQSYQVQLPKIWLDKVEFILTNEFRQTLPFRSLIS